MRTSRVYALGSLLAAICAIGAQDAQAAALSGTAAMGEALGGAALQPAPGEAARVLMSTVRQVVAENPGLADSVGDRALLMAVSRASASQPHLQGELVTVAKRLKPTLSREIELASVGQYQADVAPAMADEAPAWASAPAPSAPQGQVFAAGGGDVPEWAVAAAPVASDAAVGGGAGSDDPFALGLEDLLNTKVVTASKSKERAFDVPAAITVITNEDLRRSGYTTVTEALRMVPGMHVAQISGDSWAVSSRGFGDEYANKLLVMIDGRSVYTPTFSGVYWDMVNLPVEDVDRIEVIRGPGATVWGANAVNGVINIVTKNSKFTQGAYLTAGGGGHERAFAEGRSGGEIGEDGYYRMYSRYINRAGFFERSNTADYDSMDRLLAGFRADWEKEQDAFTLQAEVQHGNSEFYDRDTLAPGDDSELRNAYVRGRWDRNLSEGSAISLASYLDYDYRNSPVLELEVVNWDLDFSHTLRLGERNEFIWGLGYRFSHDSYDNSTYLSFIPDEDNRNLFSAFLQDKFEVIDDKLDLILGSKFEHNTYTGFEIQPTAKVSFHPNEKNTLWASVARAVRTPSRVEESIFYPELTTVDPGTPLNPTAFPVVAQGYGSEDVKAEELISYEVGYRFSPSEGLIFDLAGYYNDYDNLTAISPNFAGLAIGACPTGSPSPVCGLLPLLATNVGAATVTGAEASVSWQVLPNWKLAGFYTYAVMDVDTPTTVFGPVSFPNPLFSDYENLLPEHIFSVRSYYNITENVDLDASVYYVSELNTLDSDYLTTRTIDGYFLTDLRLGWRPLDNLELSLVGLNLLEGDHEEFIDSRFSRDHLIGRSYYGKATWRF